MGSVEFLEWDSNFFNKKIGRFTISDESSKVQLTRLLGLAQNENYELIYLFCNRNILIYKETLDRFHGEFVDTKVIFYKGTNASDLLNANVSSYTSKHVSKELVQLTLLSGKYSRFNTDSRFGEDAYSRMYKEWIEKSVSRKIADEVFIYKKANKTIGFVTVSINDKIGNIGLIAVDPSYQGKGIGKALLQKASAYVHSKLIQEIQVATQNENIAACNFYIKNGFMIRSEQDIYHFSL